MYSVKDKTIFITGGATGIGLATAKQLLDAGARVAIYSLSFKNTPDKKVLEEHKNALLIKGTITSTRQIRHAIRQTIKKFGTIDVLINNASIAQRKDFEYTTSKDWDVIIDTNIKGTLNVTQQVLEIMKKQKSGMIMMISSGSGLYGIEHLSLYSLTKAALINITQSLADEVKKYGIEFVTITPGSTATNMFLSCFPGERAYHTPQQVADIIVRVAQKEIAPDNRLVVDVFRHAH